MTLIDRFSDQSNVNSDSYRNFIISACDYVFMCVQVWMDGFDYSRSGSTNETDFAIERCSRLNHKVNNMRRSKHKWLRS